MMIDRSYFAKEVATLAARATEAMGDVPDVVALAAHTAAAAAMLEEAATVGPLPPDFRAVADALRRGAALLLILCETGPVPSADTLQ